MVVYSPLNGENITVISRNVEDRVRLALGDTPVVLLNGARQVGKTTMARAVGQRIGARYLTLDDAATLGAAVGDPSGFVRNLRGPVVLDEVQKAPDLFPAIKLAVDEDRRPGRFLLTGSANVMMLPRLAESLVGRMEVVPLHPFSAGELAGRRETFVERLFDAAPPGSVPRVPSGDVLAQLVKGGYPEAVQRTSDGRRNAWFASYVTTILMRDVRDLARVDGLHAMPSLLRLLAARTAGLLNVADVARDAGLPHTTLTRYLALLESVFLVHRLPAWSRNLGKRLVKAPKLHLIDTGLACHLVGANTNALASDRALLGRMLESFVVSELRKQISWSDSGASLCHSRTASGSEVDVVLERPDGMLAAVEVRAAATASAFDVAALKALRDGLGRSFSCGVVLYLGEHVVPFGDRLWLVPLQALWA